MNKVHTRLWYLYDFANSFASSVLIFYFPLLFAEKGGKEVLIGVASSLATLLLIIFLPPLGAWADRTGKRMPIMIVGSIGMSFALIALAYLFSFMPPDYAFFIYALLAYVLFQFCFQGSTSVYASLLRSLGPQNVRVAFSGRGLAFGQIGNVLGLVTVMPLVGGAVYVFGISGKELALLAGALLSFLLALPFFLWGSSGSKCDTLDTHFSYSALFKKIYANHRLRLYLVGIMLLTDAILTFQIYLTIYFVSVFGFSTQATTQAGVTTLCVTVISALLVFKLVKVFKIKTRILEYGALLYSFSFFVLAIMPPIPVLVYLAAALFGFSYGIVFTLARVIYAELTPPEEQTEYFSIYTLFERMVSVAGPLVWALSFLALAPWGEEIQYRGSVAFLIPVAFLGYYFLHRAFKKYSFDAPSAV